VTRGLVVLAAAAVWSAAVPASAQVIRTRPFPGIFGSGDPAKSVTQIDFLSFIAAGYESGTLSLDAGRLGKERTDSGFGNLVFRGRLAHQGRHSTFGAEAGATTSYFTGGGGMAPLSMSGSAHANGALGQRATYVLRQSFYYSPYYVFGLVQADPLDGGATAPSQIDSSVDPRVDYRSARLSTKGYATYASAARQLGEKNSFSVGYALDYTDSAPGVYDVISHAPRAVYRHSLGRFSALVASYGLNLWEYRDSPFARVGSHDVGLGVTYDRPLSSWRRTTVGFHVGTTLIRTRGVLETYLNGTAHLNRRLGRTWIAGVRYWRGQQVLDGFTAPFFTFSDSVTFSAAGRVGRDISVSGHGSYSYNRYTFGAFTNTFDTVAASTRVQVPVMWALAAYVEGYYSEHDFQNRLGLIEGIPGSVNRLGTRAGLTVSVPVLR
jgi:hypothetical protein